MQLDPLLTAKPLDIIKRSPDLLSMPIMMGYNSNEGLLMLSAILKGHKLKEFNDDLARLVPKSLNLEPEDPRCVQVADEIRDFYFSGADICAENFIEFDQLLSDYHFVLGKHLTAEVHAKYQPRYVLSNASLLSRRD